jgi:hypothetical protein
MSNPRKKKSNPFAATGKKSSSRRRNPATKSRRNPHSRRRRNPFTVAGRGPGKLVTLGISAGAGAIATRFLPNLVAKKFNDGVTGYGLNVLTAVALGMAGAKMLGQDVGEAMALGGLAATVQRVWDDKVSKVLPIAAATKAGLPTSEAANVRSIKGLGDVSYSDDGMGRYDQVQWPGPIDGGPYVAAAPAPAALPPAQPSSSAYPQPF